MMHNGILRLLEDVRNLDNKNREQTINSSTHVN